MGFELDRLMKQFGVATPSLNYSGTGVPIDPGTRPVATEALKGDDLAASQARYDNLLSKYNIDKVNYPADQALYNTYKTEYQNRMLGTPQYMQAQFQTGNEPKSDAYKYVTNPKFDAATGQGMGLKQFNTNIQNYATQNPTANTAAINAYADKYGISGQDIYNATNNRWGNTLQVPKYGTSFIPTATVTAPTITTPTVTTPTVTTPTVTTPTVETISLTPTVTTPTVTTPTVTTPTVTTPTVTTPTVDTPLTILSKPIVSDIPDTVDTNIPLITAPDILETIPSIYTKPIVSDIPDTVDTNIPLIIPETPLELPDFTVETPKTDKSFFDDPDFVDVGPSRGLMKNQEELPEEFDKYLVDGSVVDNAYNLDGTYDFRGTDFGLGGGGMGGGGKYFDDQSMATMAFAKGGAVKTHFQTGGANQPSDIDQMAENYGVGPQPDIMSYQGSKLFPMQGQAPAPVSNQMTRRDAYPPTPQSPMDARSAQLDALLQRYAGDSPDYRSELEEARTRSDKESMAFQKMIQDAMKGSADAAPSKAEMYFRLASAFGSPTKTGNFAESLSNVNKELAAYSKDERDAKKAQRALQLQMGLEGQKMRMSSAKDDLTTLRSLASEEMKSKRAITTEIIKDFIKSGEPESAAGKQAKDEGLKVGTPEFKARVNEIAQTSVDAKLAQVTATLAGMSVQQANANLAIQKFQNLQEQQLKLTPAEVALKTQTEDMLGSTTQAMEDLKRAYVLNPNTFDASLPDIAQRKILESAGVKDPKLANTREQINLLEKGALAQLKSTFPGAISDAETRTLKELQGINAKSIEERGRIMRNAFRALKAIDERSKRRLNEIKQGTYRDTTPTPEGLE
jgi:hypothetical protein